MENLCRLCLQQNDLIWVFHERFKGMLDKIILDAIGVKIEKTDIVSQKVCKKCCQVTIKVFQFRKTALRNDRDLKSRLDLYSVGMTEPKSEIVDKKKISDYVDQLPDTAKLQLFKDSFSPHETVSQLLCMYPKIKIPKSCVKTNLYATVTLNTDDITNYEKMKQDSSTREKVVPLAKPSDESKNQVLDLQSTEESVGIKRKRQDIVETSNLPCKHSQDESNICQSSHQKRNKTTHLIQGSLLRKRNVSTSSASSSTCTSSASSCTGATSSASSSTGTDQEIFTYSELTDKIYTSEVFDTELLSHVNKSKNVNICNICNAVIYSNKELKLHLRKHMNCPFCKLKFRTLEAKEFHLNKECLIRSMSQSLPTISLVRAEQIESLRTKYSETFKTVLGSQKVVENTNVVKTQEKLLSQCDDIIDETMSWIFDNDDLKTTRASNKGATSSKQSAQNKCDKAKVAPVKLNYPFKKPFKGFAPQRSTTVRKTPDYTEEYDVEEDASSKLVITMGDDMFKNLNFSDPETDFLQKLIKHVEITIELPKPSNKNIFIIQNEKDEMFVFKDLVPYLTRYKIPCNLSYNLNTTTTTYNFDPPQTVTYKNELWDPSSANNQRKLLAGYKQQN